MVLKSSFDFATCDVEFLSNSCRVPVEFLSNSDFFLNLIFFYFIIKSNCVCIFHVVFLPKFDYDFEFHLLPFNTK